LAAHPVHGGVVNMLRPELFEQARGQREAWLCVEEACERLELPFDKVESYQEESTAGPVFAWLREMLRARGPCRALEIGAGRGWAASVLAADGHEVLATDILDDHRIGLGYAARLGTHRGHAFGCVITPAESLPVRAECFDVVYCSATLRHIVDLERVLREASRVLRPGGWFVALQEPFRGILTEPAQQLQNCLFHLMARWWQHFPADASVPRVISQMRANLCASLFEMRRRVPYCLDLAESVGLQASILPTGLFLALPRASDLPAAGLESARPAWIAAVAETYRLDISRLQARVKAAQEKDGGDLLPELAAHLLLCANWDGVFLAQKCSQPPCGWLHLDSEAARKCRRLDSLLLDCASTGVVPIYGLYGHESDEEGPYTWTMPEAGFLAGRRKLLELKLTCPTAPFCYEPLRLEVRIDDECPPRLAVLLLPGRTVTLRMPLPAGPGVNDSVLVHLKACLGFLPSDATGAGGDNRLLALKLRAARTLESAE
jgi:ubiquinone/menaquinone biosynthesis C-methylase UbiE